MAKASKSTENKADVIRRKKMMSARAAYSKSRKKKDTGNSADHAFLKQSRPHLPSGSIVIDYLLGGRLNKFGVQPCPGWPKGAISNIYGVESSGKTTVALMAAAETIRRGGCVCFIDWEHAVDLTYAAALGVPVDDDELFFMEQPDTFEEGLQLLYIMISHGVDLVILDSVGAPISKVIADRKVSEQGDVVKVGWLAKAWSEYLPFIAAKISKTGTHVMGISQIREKINTMGRGKKTTEQGGRAWKFYSSVRMSFAPILAEKGKVFNPLLNKEDEQVVARKVKATVDKTKVSNMAHSTMEFWVVFGEGIDNLRTVLEVGQAHKIVEKSGSWYSWVRSSGEEIRAQGITRLKSTLLDTEGAMEELYTQVMNRVQEVAAKQSTITSHEESEDEMDLDQIMAEASGDFDLESMKSEPHPDAVEPDD